MFELKVRIGGKLLKAALRQVLFLNNMTCEVCGIVICSNRSVIIKDAVCSFDAFVRLVRDGKIATSVVSGAHIYLPDLVSFDVKNVRQIAAPAELIKEIRDVIATLNNRSTTMDRCRTAYRAFKQRPSVQNRERLRKAYLRIPKHMDIHLFPFPWKPSEIEEVFG